MDFLYFIPKHVISEDEGKEKEKVEIITEAMCLY